jgi:hypothetical protein
LNNYKLTVAKLSYVNPTLVGVGSDGTSAYYGAITVSAASNVPVLGSTLFAPRTVLYVYLTVDSSGTVTGCGPVAPVLPSAPPPPPAASITDFNNEVDKGCSAIGGVNSNGVCTIHSCGVNQ